MYSIKILISFFSIFIIFNYFSSLNAESYKYASVKYNSIYIRENPSKNSKIVAKVYKNTRLELISKSNEFYQVVVVGKDIKGWIYSKGLYNFSGASETTEATETTATSKEHPAKAKDTAYLGKFQFNSIKNDAKDKILEFKELLNFSFYPKSVKVIWSFDDKFNVGRVFIESDFDPEFYSKNKDESIKPNQIDLYPFLKFTSVYGNFLKKLGKKYQSLSDFLDKFSLNILIKRDKDTYIIVEAYRDKKLFLFKPDIYVKYKYFDMIKVTASDKDMVKKSYIFSLGVPYLSDNSKTVDSLLYDFFNLPY